MKADELTSIMFLHTADLWRKIMGGGASHWFKPIKDINILESDLKHMKKDGDEGLRVGSKYSTNTKICMKNNWKVKKLVMYANLNISRESLFRKEADQGAALFLRCTNNFFYYIDSHSPEWECIVLRLQDLNKSLNEAFEQLSINNKKEASAIYKKVLNSVHDNDPLMADRTDYPFAFYEMFGLECIVGGAVCRSRSPQILDEMNETYDLHHNPYYREERELRDNWHGATAAGNLQPLVQCGGFYYPRKLAIARARSLSSMRSQGDELVNCYKIQVENNWEEQ